MTTLPIQVIPQRHSPISLWRLFGAALAEASWNVSRLGDSRDDFDANVAGQAIEHGLTALASLEQLAPLMGRKRAA